GRPQLVVAQVLAVDVADHVRVVELVVQVGVEDRTLVGRAAGHLDLAEEAVPLGVGGRAYRVEVEGRDLRLPVGLGIGVAHERHAQLAMTTLLAVVLNDTKMPSGPAAPVPSTCAVNGWSNTRSKCTT